MRAKAYSHEDRKHKYEYGDQGFSSCTFSPHPDSGRSGRPQRRPPPNQVADILSREHSPDQTVSPERGRSPYARVSILPCPFQPCQQMRRAEHASPRGLPCGSVRAMSGPWAFQPPLTDGHVRPFVAYIALFPAPSTHPSATNKRRGFKCSRAKHASLALALLLHPCNVRPVGFSAARTQAHAHHFIALSALSPIPSSHLPGTEKAPRLYALARGSLARN